MTTMDELAWSLADTLVDEIGPHESPEIRERERQIAATAAIRMSNRLNKSIDVDTFFERTIEFQAKAVGIAEAHIQVIVLAGYAAYFALWSAMAAELPAWALLASGALMTISVVVFVGWTVAGLIFAKFSTDRILNVYRDGTLDFLPRYQQAEEHNLASRAKIMRWWAPVVAVAGFTALTAALILSIVGGVSFVQRVIASHASEASQ